MVRNSTVVAPGSDAAVIRVLSPSGKTKFLAMSVDCNGTYCLLDPREGGKQAMAEACRNVTMSGGLPLAATDNLNFGNPHNPEIFWQLREAVEGIAEACRVFDAPVTGGNVSLYNQSPAGAIDPTPTVGVVGLIEDEKHITTSFFKKPGDAILLVGGPGSEIGGTTYLKTVFGLKKGEPPTMDLHEEKNFQDAVRSLIRCNEVRSAHDISEGGLAVTLAECCFGPETLGAEVYLPFPNLRPDVLLFNESQSRAVLTVRKENAHALADVLRWRGIEVNVIGHVTAGPDLKINLPDRSYEWPVSQLKDAWENSLPSVLS
jgi:phosphoribosylformylglycinamidine synthase